MGIYKSMFESFNEVEESLMEGFNPSSTSDIANFLASQKNLFFDIDAQVFIIDSKGNGYSVSEDNINSYSNNRGKLKASKGTTVIIAESRVGDLRKFITEFNHWNIFRIPKILKKSVAKQLGMRSVDDDTTIYIVE